MLRWKHPHLLSCLQKVVPPRMDTINKWNFLVVNQNLCEVNWKSLAMTQRRLILELPACIDQKACPFIIVACPPLGSLVDVCCHDRYCYPSGLKSKQLPQECFFFFFFNMVKSNPMPPGLQKKFLRRWILRHPDCWSFCFHHTNKPLT